MRVLWNVCFIMLSCILYSCKKENDSITTGTSYHRTIKNESSIRVFANSGEIKNQSILDRFQQTDDQSISNLSKYLGGLDTIRILDGINASLFEYSRYSDFTYSKISKDYNFSSKDTFTGYSYGDVYTRSAEYAMCLYKPVVYSETIVSSTAGVYQFQYKGRRQYFIEKDKDRLIAPWIVYNFHTGALILNYTLQNKLDPKFYKTMQFGDTVALREYSVVYE